MATRDQPGDGWTVVRRRQPARMVEGRPEGGYTDAFEIICCDCGDRPGMDLQQGLTRASADPRALPASGGHSRISRARPAAPEPAGDSPVSPPGWLVTIIWLVTIMRNSQALITPPGKLAIAALIFVNSGERSRLHRLRPVRRREHAQPASQPALLKSLTSQLESIFGCI